MANYCSVKTILSFRKNVQVQVKLKNFKAKPWTSQPAAQHWPRVQVKRLSPKPNLT